jgi:hypothetical protein
MLSAAWALSFASPAHADSAATIRELEQTPVSLLTYGLDALRGGLNSYIGRGGGQPNPAAMFKAPFSGPIADIATVIFNGKDNTILLNFVKIDSLGQSDGQGACNQAFASIRFDAGLDPTTGKLQSGVDATFFSADGTLAQPPATDATALDQAFRLRYVGQANGKRFVCTGRLLGTDATLELPK